MSSFPQDIQPELIFEVASMDQESRPKAAELLLLRKRIEWKKRQESLSSKQSTTPSILSNSSSCRRFPRPKSLATIGTNSSIISMLKQNLSSISKVTSPSSPPRLPPCSLACLPRIGECRRHFGLRRFVYTGCSSLSVLTVGSSAKGWKLQDIYAVFPGHGNPFHRS